MHRIKYLFLILATVAASDAWAQTIELDRVVIGSAHSEYDNGSDFTLSATVGEPMTITRSNTNLIITEGFQQSNYVLSDPLVADLITDSAACIGANDGAVGIEFVSEKLTTPLSYAWSTGSTDEALVGLEAGTYTVTVTGANGLSVTNTATVYAIDSVDCTPGFYTGITPNNDNSNDYWHVDNAEFFTTKAVKIFNRYGAKVWESDQYDNFNNSFTGNHQNGQPLPVGTYYFIAEFDDSNYKGWIEVSR